MKRCKRTALWAAACLAALCPAITRAQPPAAASHESENAALQYWQAFTLMPVLDDDQRELLDNWQTIPLDDTASKLVESSRSSLMYLRRGAKLRHCDWGLDYDDGIGLLLPHLAKARELARLAALHARYSFEQGDRQSAREDAHAMMVLARHVGRDPIMISVLVRYLIEGMALDVLEPRVAESKAPHAFVVSQYAALPPAPSVKDTVLVEKRTFIEWVAKKLRADEQARPGSWREQWKNLLGAEASNDLREIETFEEALRLLESIGPVYDELAKILVLPRSEFDAEYAEFKRRTAAANPLTALLLPSVDKLRATEDRNQARLALLMAAMAVAHSGPEALQEIRDPFGDGPFEYRKLDDGFELKSKLVHEGEPVTLEVTTAARP
jgi:hypothetical protein